MQVRSPLHAVVHQDSEIIPKERASDTESPGGSDNKGLPNDEKDGRDERRKGLRKKSYPRLVRKGIVIPTKLHEYHSYVGKGIATYKKSRSNPKLKIERAKK